MRQFCFLLIVVSQLGFSQQQLSPNAPADKPVHAKGDGVLKLQNAIRPYVEQAKRTYPDAKERYQKGLPQGDIFFITAPLHDVKGRTEQVFVQVTSVVGDTILGRIASVIYIVDGYKAGQEIMVLECDLIDWLIAKPDGSEEGNVVGKFLDTYKQQ